MRIVYLSRNGTVYVGHPAHAIDVNPSACSIDRVEVWREQLEFVLS